MPEQCSPEADALGRVVAALNEAVPELDGTALADLLWLAARLDGAALVGATSRSTRSAEGDQAPQDAPGASATDTGDDSDREPERALHERLAGTRGRVRGDAVAVSGAGGLPGTLAVTRALRPWKRRWPQGCRSTLDMDATVDAYARSGELVPQFRPAPERWFGLVLVVDRSPAMQVWQEVIDDFTAVLNRLGAFRTLQVCDLAFGERGPELRDAMGRLIGPGRLRSPDGRRLVVTVSDCAHPGWREPDVWRSLREWATSTPVALLNPLPPKLWRRTGLDLPGVRVLPGAPGAGNAQLGFEPPSLLPGEAAGWLPVPVLSLSPHSLGRWSRTLMRRAPEGCGAVLVPRSGRLPVERPAPRVRTDSADRFLRTASPAAARLAVLSSPFDELSIRLLHLIRQELVPEAEVADIAELITSGLFPVGTDRTGTVELRVPPTTQERLRKELTEHEVWRINRALSRHMASHGGWSGPMSAVAHHPLARAELPAALRPFAEASWRTLELLGLADGGAQPEREPTPVAARPTVGESRPSRSRVDNRPYFFLSYAHTPPWGSGGGDPDHWVQSFYQDLCSHIMALTSLPGNALAGYMDRETPAGEGWSEELSRNLATCRVFVPLLSPRYFTSEMCGREWYAFNERILQARAAGTAGAGPEPICPVFWTRVNPEQLPESVRHIHLYGTLGSRYETNGIYGLVKLSRLRDEYEEVVLSLAQRIVRVAEESSLPPTSPRPYESTPSAFKPRGEDPRRIHLTVVAPARHNIPVDRDARPYGEDPEDWNPYHSESTRPIAYLAEELTRALDYRVTVSSFDEQVSEPVEDTGSVSHPGILLIDPWSLTDEERRARLKAFDASSPPWLAAIIPWNRLDMQNHSQEGRSLMEGLERVLPFTLERGQIPMAVNGVPTLKAFTDLLPAVVARLARQYATHAAAAPAPPGPRPRLRGPDLPSPSSEARADRGDKE
ncbi:TIR-like protein FxsC [Streptomyces canus]|uniref:TIR-like protein FxsC n=1 Tax=Streptomyces canus TaxID=58343 RepID=UPI0036F10F89